MLLWRLTQGAAIVGFIMVATVVVLLIWLLFEIGYSWIAGVLLVLVAWLLFSSVKNRKRHAGFDIRR